MSRAIRRYPTWHAKALEPEARVVLPDEEPEDRHEGGRTGENQELRRKIVHGPYRPIDDRGAPSDVRLPRQP